MSIVMTERAYFTPSREEFFEIQRHLLNGLSPLSINFNTEVRVDVDPNKLPVLNEHDMKVVKAETVAGGYAIFGTMRGGAEDGADGVLNVDTTVEPPVATYSIM